MIRARAPPSTLAVSAALSSVRSSRLSVFISRPRVMVTSAISGSGQVSVSASPDRTLPSPDAGICEVLLGYEASMRWFEHKPSSRKAGLDKPMCLRSIIQPVNVFNSGLDPPARYEIERVSELRARHALCAKDRN